MPDASPRLRAGRLRADGPIDACLIANPAAGAGRGARELAALRIALASRGVTDVRVSQAPGDERRLAREAAAAGTGTIIALGGDGTWGNCARGILESARAPRMALLAAGTGNDFAQGLGLPVGDYQTMIEIALGAREQRVDVGRADGAHFLNVAGFGIETSVLESIQKSRAVPGPMLYLATAARELRHYEALAARLAFDGDSTTQAGRYLAVIVANGRRFGGGFRIAPQAELDDGALDFVAVRDTSLLRRASILARARFGLHGGLPEVEQRRVDLVRVTFEAPPKMDIDGELTTAASPTVEIRCVPSALRVASAR